MRYICQVIFLYILLSGCAKDPVNICIKFKPETTLEMVSEYVETENVGLIWTKQLFEGQEASVEYDYEFKSRNAYVDYSKDLTSEDLKKRWQELHEHYILRLQNSLQNLVARDSVIVQRLMTSCAGIANAGGIAAFLDGTM